MKDHSHHGSIDRVTRRRSRARLLLGSLVIGIFLQCTNADTSRRDEPRLDVFATPRLSVEVVQTYGAADLSAGSAITSLDTAHAADVLSNIADVAEGPDSTVYVADRDYQKVVVFQRDGTYDRVIVGGYGEGPGEFVRIRSISVSPDGRLAVLDEGNNRVSIFGPDDELDTTFDVGSVRPLQIAFAGDTILLMHWHGSADDRAIIAFSTDGDSLGSLIDLSARDVHFAEFGSAGVLAQGTATGTTLYAPAMPGQWTVLGQDGTAEHHGREMFPEVQGLTLHDDRGPLLRMPVSTRDVGISQDGSVFVAFTHHPDPTNIQSRRFDLYVARFTKSDELAGLAEVSSVVGPAMVREISGLGNEIYGGVIDPFPHVKRVRLTQVMEVEQ